MVREIKKKNLSIVKISKDEVEIINPITFDQLESTGEITVSILSDIFGLDKTEVIDKINNYYEKHKFINKFQVVK